MARSLARLCVPTVRKASVAIASLTRSLRYTRRFRSLAKRPRPERSDSSPQRRRLSVGLRPGPARHDHPDAARHSPARRIAGRCTLARNYRTFRLRGAEPGGRCPAVRRSPYASRRTPWPRAGGRLRPGRSRRVRDPRTRQGAVVRLLMDCVQFIAGAGASTAARGSGTARHPGRCRFAARPTESPQGIP